MTLTPRPPSVPSSGPRRPGRRVIALSVAAVALLGAACGSDDETTRDEDGAIVEEGELSAFSINEGDCIVGAATGVVSGFEGVPCSEPHDNEVFLTFDMPEGDYPGDAPIQSEAETRCLAGFETFVGTPYETSIYGLTWLAPTEESWNRVDDREIACLVNNFDGTQKTGSAGGTGL